MTEAELRSAFTDKQRVEIKQIVHEALSEFFTGYGKSSKRLLVTTAVIFASIMAIGGGLKTMLAWIGISILRQ